VLFDLHGRSSLPNANAASGVGVPAAREPGTEGIPVNDHIRLASEMVFEWPCVVTDLV
jgi:hypothetical protein